MLKEFDSLGLWWIPNIGNKVHGRITFKQSEGLYLQLSETFLPVEHFFDIKPEADTPSIILGELDSGEKITLYDCFVRKMSARGSGNCTAIYTCNHYFKGAHFASPNDIAFTSVTVSFSYFESWLLQHFYKSNKRSISYGKPKLLRHKIKTLKSFILISSEISKSITFGKNISLENIASIIIQPDSPSNYEWYKSTLFDVQNFLVLNIGEPIIPTSFIGNTEQRDEVEIYFLLRNYTIKEKTPRSIVHFPEYGKNFRTCLNNWFSKQEKLRTTAQLLIGSYYSSSMYPYLTFLTFTQALEAYHRHVFGGYFLPKEKYEPCRTAMVAAIPAYIQSDQRDSLKSRVKYGYEYSLRKRLSEVLKGPCNEIFNDFIDNQSEFIVSIVNTRNYLTHYDTELKANALDGIELYYLIRKLRAILVILLLYETGLPIDTLRKCIKKADQFSQLNRSR